MDTSNASGVRGTTTLDRFTPMPSTAAFRDLLIFEERLKQNAARLKNRKQKYQGVSSVTYANSFPRVLGHVYFVYVVHRITCFIRGR